MQAITTEVKTHVIITMDGTRHFINERECDVLREVGQADLFETGGQMLKGSSISQVLTVEKFWQDHPDERPAGRLPEYRAEAPMPWSKAKHVRVLESMIEGLKEQRRGSEKKHLSDKLLKKMNNRLVQIKNCTDDKVPAFPSMASFLN